MELASFLVGVIVGGKHFRVYRNSEESVTGRVLQEGEGGMQNKRDYLFAECKLRSIGYERQNWSEGSSREMCQLA